MKNKGRSYILSEVLKMPSEKVTRILKSKSNFTEEEINSMSERDAWDWVYKEKNNRQ